MTISILALEGKLNGKVLLLRFFICRVYVQNLKASKSQPESCYAKSMSEWFAPSCTPGKRCAVYFVDLFGSFDS